MQLFNRRTVGLSADESRFFALGASLSGGAERGFPALRDLMLVKLMSLNQRMRGSGSFPRVIDSDLRRTSHPRRGAALLGGRVTAFAPQHQRRKAVLSLCGVCL
jgi:hypothetical protein